MDYEIPLLKNTVDGAVDYKGQPVLRSSSGGWKSASFLIGAEVAERFSYYRAASNLITYLTGPLGQSMATAAKNVNVLSGTSTLLTLFGALVADSFLGRYHTIVFASLIYILGFGLLTFSTTLPTKNSSVCEIPDEISSCSVPKFQVILFFVSLYLILIGHGGHKPCVQAFGADQFDGLNSKECKSKSSFFNWWYFSVCTGTFVAIPIVTYIQENLSWSLGFGIPCVSMVISFFVFVLGTKTYSYSVKQFEKSSFVRIGLVFMAAIRNRRTSASTSSITSIEEEGGGDLSHQSTEQFKFLNGALFGGAVCSVRDVEEAKAILRIIPIWITIFVYAIVVAQDSTLFTKQGATMDRSILSGVIIPAGKKMKEKINWRLR